MRPQRRMMKHDVSLSKGKQFYADPLLKKSIDKLWLDANVKMQSLGIRKTFTKKEISAIAAEKLTNIDLLDFFGGNNKKKAKKVNNNFFKI